MDKENLLQWLKDEHQAWLTVIAQFNSSNWEKPGLAGYWSMKDVLAHLTGWNRRLVSKMEAVQNNMVQPLPPWPSNLKTDDEINAWFYETNHSRTVAELLDDEKNVFELVLKIVMNFPDDVEIETIHQGNRDYYLVNLHNTKIQPGEFFDHFHDDHEKQIRLFLEKEA